MYSGVQCSKRRRIGNTVAVFRPDDNTALALDTSQSIVEVDPQLIVRQTAHKPVVVALLKEHDFNAGSRRNQALHDLLASPVNRGLEGGPTGTAKARVAHVPEPVAIVGFCVQRYPFAAGVSDELRHEGKRLQNGGPSRVVR